MSAQHKLGEIVIDPVFPPIPLRGADYAAYRKDYDSGNLVGRGDTPEAAIADLLDQEWEHEE